MWIINDDTYCPVCLTCWPHPLISPDSCLDNFRACLEWNFQIFSFLSLRGRFFFSLHSSTLIHTVNCSQRSCCQTGLFLFDCQVYQPWHDYHKLIIRQFAVFHEESCKMKCLVTENPHSVEGIYQFPEGTEHHVDVLTLLGVLRLWRKKVMWLLFFFFLFKELLRGESQPVVLNGALPYLSNPAFSILLTVQILSCFTLLLKFRAFVGFVLWDRCWQSRWPSCFCIIISNFLLIPIIWCSYFFFLWSFK